VINPEIIRTQIIKIQERPNFTVRIVVVAAVVMMSIALAFVNSPRILLAPILIIGGVYACIFLLKRPTWGFLGIIIASLLLPSPFGGGRAERINPTILLQVLLIGLWILDMIARRKKIHLVPSRTNTPVLLFMLMAFIGLINAQLNYYPLVQLASPAAQFSALSIFVLSGTAFLLVGNTVKDVIWLRRMTWLFIALGTLYIIGRILPLERWVNQIFRQGSVDASLFWVWLISLVSSQLLMNNKLGQRTRIALGLALAGALYIALVPAYSWKSGWVPSIVAIAVIVFLSMPRFRYLAIFMGVIAVLVGFSTLGGAVTGGEDYSISTRYEAWRLVVEITNPNPILGVGLANYYWYSVLFPILGYRVNYNSHNNYVDLYAQMGIIGVLLFLWFAWEVGKLAWRLHSSVPEGFEKAYVIGAMGGLIGTLVSGVLGDWILPFVYNVGLLGYRSSIFSWLFLGGLVAIEQIYSANRHS
jgi:hypothetical protein